MTEHTTPCSQPVGTHSGEDITDSLRKIVIDGRRSAYHFPLRYHDAVSFVVFRPHS